MGLKHLLRRAYRGLGSVPVVGRAARATADALVKPAAIRVEAWAFGMRQRHGRGAYAATVSNTRSGYDRLYREPALLREYLTAERSSFYEALAGYCVTYRPRSLVDVGCGSGHLLSAISDRLGADVELVGIDHAPSGIDRLGELVPNAEGIVADIVDLDLGGRTFDLVVCSEVLEQLEEPRVALSTLERLRSPGGTILITVPDGEQDSFAGHVNFWSDAGLARFLAPVGVAEVRRIGPSDDLLAILR